MKSIYPNETTRGINRKIVCENKQKYQQNSLSDVAGLGFVWKEGNARIA
jgi:hypothetical protein